ncbi:hypothetical protein [Mycolicibacterium litorale]|uniref:Uncharacterized protein n=1 Tax=Mycolicibacterium litorale TaxID=758802 RepID=A0AAD1IPE4_9MYCO|nr:hypothetical protein [Mycolicibacterium litorale]MCV7417955.1 hypothetical protein [Mycolicibacterium litorale]TDY06657.1 hypothetical protein BCL50_2982 [Mycolicibacterium litorale]BBY19194.1 hypothetical protein MLIT_47860 [Mycolicibacterium litorale]
MIVIVGLIFLGAAAIVAVVGLLSNAGPAHQLADGFSLVGYTSRVPGTLFLSGIAVGAVAPLGLGLVLGGARRTANRGRKARRQLAVSQRETAFINREHVDAGASTATASRTAPTARPRSGVLGRWRRRQPAKTARVDRSW